MMGVGLAVGDEATQKSQQQARCGRRQLIQKGNTYRLVLSLHMLFDKTRVSRNGSVALQAAAGDGGPGRKTRKEAYGKGRIGKRLKVSNREKRMAVEWWCGEKPISKRVRKKAGEAETRYVVGCWDW
jgi:hypothetical protein